MRCPFCERRRTPKDCRCGLPTDAQLAWGFLLSGRRVDSVPDRDLADLFTRRITLWLLEPARLLFLRRYRKRPDSTHMATLTLLCCALDALGAVCAGKGGRSGIVALLKSFGPHKEAWRSKVGTGKGRVSLAQRFAETFRDSLVHSFRLAKGAGYQSKNKSQALVLSEQIIDGVPYLTYNTKVLNDSLQGACRESLAWLRAEAAQGTVRGHECLQALRNELTERTEHPFQVRAQGTFRERLKQAASAEEMDVEEWIRSVLEARVEVDRARQD